MNSQERFRNISFAAINPPPAIRIAAGGAGGHGVAIATEARQSLRASLRIRIAS
jgi:hypothetical protein